MSDLTPKQREQIADACDAAFDFGDTWIRFLRNGDESMLLPVVAQMLADERERIAQAIEASGWAGFHQDRDHYRRGFQSGLESAARIAREDRP